jgi:hypothetical protein
VIRLCPHGVQVGPLDDYNVPDDQPVSPYSAYCWKCNGLDGPDAAHREPAAPKTEVSGG